MNEAPLNYLQRYILKHQEETPGTTMFNLAKMFRLRKGMDLEKLADCLAKAGRAHQALLSVMHRFEGGEVLQMQELDDEDIQVEIVRVPERNLLARRSSYIKIFDTFDEGLVDAIVFDCGKNAYLLSNIHHLVCDGYSFPLILDEAHRAWNGETLEQDRYYDVLAKRAARSCLPVVVAASNLLVETLKSRPFTTLPRFDFSGHLGYGSLEVPLELPADFAAKLERWHASRHHFFLSATAVALARMTGATDVEVDWVFHGRLSKDELRTVGAFMVDLPFVLSDFGEKTPDDVVFLTKQSTFFGIKNCHAIRDSEDDPLGGARTTFVYQDMWGELMSPGPVDPEGPFAWMIEETIPLRPPKIAAENPLNVEIMEHRDGTKLFVEYDSGRYARTTVECYVECYREAMAWLLGGDR